MTDSNRPTIGERMEYPRVGEYASGDGITHTIIDFGENASPERRLLVRIDEEDRETRASIEMVNYFFGGESMIDWRDEQ